MKNYVDGLGVGEPNWNANYSQFIVNNESLTNYINSNNNSLVNYIGVVNTSVTNTFATKLNLAGGTMTGNISLGNSGVRLSNGTSNTACIYHNGTGWVIKG